MSLRGAAAPGTVAANDPEDPPIARDRPAAIAQHLSCVVAIVEGDRLVGLLTERDLVRLTSRGIDFRETTAARVMTRDWIAVDLATANDPFALVERFRQHRIRHVPVLDARGALLGIATPESVRAALHPADLLALRRVEEVMVREVIAIAPEETVEAAARRMADYRVSCTVVVEGEGWPVPGDPRPDEGSADPASEGTRRAPAGVPLGMLTERDIVRLQGQQADLSALTAGEAASRPIQAIAADATLWAAHQRMSECGVRRLVVCDERGHLAGIVTQTSLLQVLDPSEMYATVSLLQQALSQLQDVPRAALLPPQKREPTSESGGRSAARSAAGAAPPPLDGAILNGAILDAIASPVVILDGEGRVQRVNRAFAALAGYPVAAAVGRWLWDCWVPSEDRDAVRDVLTALLTRAQNVAPGEAPAASGHEQAIETRHRGRRILQWSNAVVTDETGAIAHVVCTGTDATERRAADQFRRQRELTGRDWAARLEARVAERTRALEAANADLQRALADKERVAQALEETRTQLHFLLTSSPAVIYSCRASDNFATTAISDNMERIFGYGLQECFDNPALWAENVHPDDRERVVAVLDRIAELETYRHEYRFRRADGTYRWILDEFRVLRDEAGQPTELVGYLIDTTDRHRDREALQDREATLKALFDAIPESIFLVDAAGTVLQVNETGARRLETEPERLLGTCLYDAFPPEVARERRLKIQQVLESGCPIRDRDRRDSFKFETFVYPVFDASGRATKVAIFAQDTSEWQRAQAALAESERRFRALFEQANAGIVAADFEGRFLMANQKYQEMVGYSFEELKKTDFLSLTHPDDVWQDLELIDRILRKKQARFTLEKRYLRKNGETIWVSISGSTVFDDAGNPEYVIGVAFDISARKIVEIGLRTSHAILRSFYDSVSLMMGIVEVRWNEIFHLWDNPATGRYFGRSPDDLHERTATDLGVPADVQAIWLQHYRESQESGGPVRFEYCHTFNGEERWFAATVCPIVPASGGEAMATVFGGDRFCYVAEDITERRQAAAKLRRATETLLEAQRIAHIGYWDFHVPTQTIAWSAETFRIFGLDPEGEPPSYERFFDCIHPDDRDRHRAAVETAIANRQGFEVESRVQRPDGQTCHLETRAHLECDAGGNPLRLFGLAIDITDRKRAEIALRTSEERYRLLLEHMPAAIYTASLDANSTTTYISPQIEKLLGYGATEWLENPNLWHDCLYPDDRETVLAELARSRPIDREFLCEYRVIRKDGRKIWVRDSATVVLDEVGQPLCLQGIMLDISDRKLAEEALRESEERYELATSGGRVGVWDWNLRDGQFYISPVLKAMLGYRDSELPNELEPWAALVHPDDRERVMAAARAHLAGDSPRYEAEHRMIRKDGSIAWIFVRGRAFRDADGTPYRLVGSDTDITELKEAQLALERANQKLATSNAELERRHRNLVAIGQMVEFLHACATVSEASRAIAEFLKQLFPQCSGGAFALDRQTLLMGAIATFGDFDDGDGPFSLEDCWALRRGRPHLFSEKDSHMLCAHATASPRPARSLCVPMLAEGRIIGLLFLRCPAPDGLDDADQQLARTVAEQISLALANLNLRQKLREESIRDALTGLYNRRYLEASLRRELARAQRSRQTLGVLMIDVDRFKSFNDTFGHEAGDAVLRAIGQLLMQQGRESDVACRYGGEELTVILPNLDGDRAYQRAERFREAVRVLTVDGGDRPLSGITVSVGVAVYPDHGDTPGKLLRQADAALYRAKTEGRNCTVLASMDPDATDPDATDPGATDLDATDPGATDPDATDPDATDPDATPTATPDAADPDATPNPTLDATPDAMPNPTPDATPNTMDPDVTPATTPATTPNPTPATDPL